MHDSNSTYSIERLEYIHSKDIIHRDIKPGNLLEDIKTKKLLYLIDFGLAKKFRSSKTGNHIKFSIPRKLTGTARFSSINAIRGAEQSRRDDLESAGYFLIYLAKKGFLPWQSIKTQDKMERYKQTYMLKKNIEPEELCSHLPNEFSQYIRYVRELKFEENPNYIFMKGLFISILNKLGFKNDLFFSWLIKEKKNIDPNILKVNGNKLRKVSPHEKIIRKIKVINKNKEKEKEKDIFNDNKASNSKFEFTGEKSETQIFNSSSKLEDNQLSNFKPKTDQQMANKNYPEKKINNIPKNNFKLNSIKENVIFDYKKKVNNGVESKPIYFDPMNYTFKDSISQINNETKDKIIPKNINIINKLCNQLLNSKKNKNFTNNTKIPISSPNNKNLHSLNNSKSNNMKNKKKILIEVLNKKGNNDLTKKLINQKYSKDSNPILKKDIKYIKINNNNFSEFNTFISSPEKINEDTKNLDGENNNNQMNDSFFKINSIKNKYVSNSEINSFITNKNTEYNSKQRLILNTNNTNKNARANNGFDIYNNSIGNNCNINSLPNNTKNNFKYNADSSSYAFNHSITYRNNPKNILFKNNSSIRSYLDQKSSPNTSENFSYKSPQILQDLKKSENQKENIFSTINSNNNNNNTDNNTDIINKCLYNYSNVDSSKKKGNLNLYQYNNYIIKYNINWNKDNQSIPPDLSINKNNKHSSFSKNNIINKSNDYKLFQRINNKKNIINSNNANNVSNFLYQSSSSNLKNI